MNKRKGFTIIEFAIVVAIAGIMVCVLKIGFDDMRSRQHPRTYRLGDGTETVCSDHFEHYCGVSLRGCEDGIERECQTNVEVLP